MQIGVYRYTFQSARKNSSPQKLSQSDCREISKSLNTDEWIFVDFGNSCEFYFVSIENISHNKIIKFLTEKKWLPKDVGIEQTVLNGRDAVNRFLQISVGAAGSFYGKPFLETLHEAFHLASERGHIGPVFHRLFQRGIWLHEKARQETNFFRYAVAQETVVGELAGKIFGAFTKANIHIIGRHPMVQPILQELYRAGCRKFGFWGNAGEVDEALSQQLNGFLRITDSLTELPEEADILVACPSQTHIFSEETIRKRIKRRSKAPLLIFDYSNSLDHKRLKKISNCYIYSEQDIEKLIDFNKTERRESARIIDRWIGEEIEAFYEWVNSEDRYCFAGMVGATPEMQRVFEMISRISRTNITVLIDGESGTGKEMVAKAIHAFSNRSEKPFKVINCGAIPENLLESELFGHDRGAFTGAVAQKDGLFKTAANGTVFLDEIAELPQQLQVKLLRFLQEGEIKRVGSTETIKIDVRVLAATNKKLSEMVESGQFRSDLFYRLNVIQLTMPPLRERRKDIPLLIKHFIKKYAAKLQKEISDVSPETLSALENHSWPGNIRELENTIERSVALAFGKVISLYDLPPNLQQAAPNGADSLKTGQRLTLKELEKKYILESLEAFDWDYDQVCKELAIGRTTLWRKLKEYNLEN